MTKKAVSYVTDEQVEKEAYSFAEEDLLKGLLAAADDQESDYRVIEIARKGKVLFKFRVHGLQESQYAKCRDRATKYKRNKQFGGIKMPEDTDTAKYRSLLIYEATLEEDRNNLWDNKKAWEELGVINGPDLIEKVLKAGEKDLVVEIIEELSGYQDELEEVAKN